MASILGKGKIRLIAKKGWYKETATTARLRNLVDHGADPAILADPTKALDYTDADAAPNYFVEFDVTPDITESGSVSYVEESEIRGPGSILMYMGSPSRNFSINAKLVARNIQEAKKVSTIIHILKSWRQPETYVGGVGVNGTPAVLYLQGYGNMFKDIPVVMTDLSIDFSSEHDAIAYGSDNFEVNYVYGSEKEGNKVITTRTREIESAVPIIVPVSISLKEARAIEDVDGLDEFDILKYRTGKLMGW